MSTSSFRRERETAEALDRRTRRGSSAPPNLRSSFQELPVQGFVVTRGLLGGNGRIEHEPRTRL